MIANIAQLVELLICNQWVGSSSLSVGTIKPLGFPRVLFYLGVHRQSMGQEAKK